MHFTPFYCMVCWCENDDDESSGSCCGAGVPSNKKSFVDAAANLPQGIGGLRSWDLPFISSSHHQTKKEGEGEEVFKKSWLRIRHAI